MPMETVKALGKTTRRCAGVFFTTVLLLTVAAASLMAKFSDVWIETTEECMRDSDDSSSLLEQNFSSPWLERRHPGCFNEALLSPNRSLSLWERGRFVLNDQDEEPNYDHVTCFLMKSRYNCAKSTAPKFGDAAFHYKLVLQPRQQENMASNAKAELCDLKALMVDLEGPGRYLSKHVTVDARHNRTSYSSTKPIQILLLGNSLLRQTFESIGCTYRDHITSVHVQVGGPILTSAKMAERAPNKFRTDELGRLQQLDPSHPQGCHDGLNPHFYEANVTMPTSIDNCNDDVASIVFDDNIEFIYVFRPNLFENQTELLNFAGVDPDRVHTVVVSKRTELQDEVLQMLRRPRYQYWDLHPFRQMQQRDLHRWFGADNPGMVEKPDGHGCMPGVPDDEANLLLYSLLANTDIMFDRRR